MKKVLIAGMLLLAAVCGFTGRGGEAEPPTAWSRWTEIDGATVHYVDTAPGSDLPVLLVLPGFLGSTVTYQSLAELLRGDLRVVIPDLPGFGWSDAPPGGCTIDDRLAFVSTFVDVLGLEPLHVAGSSLGATIAIRYAVANPHRVRRIVLLSPFGLREQRGIVTKLERLDPLLPLIAFLVSRARLKRELAKQVRDPAMLTRDILEAYRRPFRTVRGRRVVVAVARQMLSGGFFDECLDLVGQPTLVLAGSEDPLRSHEILGVLESRMPSCTAISLAGCRHLIQLEEPDQVAGLIARFCAAGEP